MKVAFILSPYCYYTNVFSGVVVQANCWAESLRELGHQVDFPQAQQPIDWKSYDLVHLYQHGSWCDSLLNELTHAMVRIVYSPIIDPPRPYGHLAHLISKIPFEKLRLQQNQRLLRKYGQTVNLLLARSQFEARSIEAVGVAKAKIVNVPISLSKNWNIDQEMLFTRPRKRSVLHVSHLAQPRKNVRMLVEVAIERGFELRLAGSLSDTEFSSWLHNIMSENANITYLGRISDEEMMDEMLTCSVFCLPSLFEGVGLVALDAGYCGSNLAVTTAGGTRDYLGQYATYFDPLDRKGMGDAIMYSLSQTQPNVAGHRHIAQNFSKKACGRLLEITYADCVCQ